MNIPLGKYRHFKGGRYTVLTLAKHSETEEEMVVYVSLTTGGIFVRPVSMWVEEVQWPDGRTLPRFIPDPSV